MMKHKSKVLESYDEGAALVVSLWLSLILALLAIAIISISRKTTLENKVQMQLEKSWVSAEGGIALAAYHIADTRAPWRPQIEPYTARLGEQDITIYVISPQAKIDLNGAIPALLSSLFRELGYEDKLADKLADAIADWRDEDELVRLNGAELRAYLEAGLEDGPANTTFKDISQLRTVLGVDGNIYKCAYPYLTLYAPSGRVDPYLARGIVRKAAGLGDIPPSQIPSVRRASLAGQVFEVHSQVPISEHSAARIIAIIRFTGNPADPVWRHSIIRDVVPIRKEAKTAKLPLSCPVDATP